MSMKERHHGMLSIGDTVLWAGSWGTEPYERAVVGTITLCDEPNSKRGDEFDKLEWNRIKDRDVIINLDNGHWAWGFQLKPLVRVVK